MFMEVADAIFVDVEGAMFVEGECAICPRTVNTPCVRGSQTRSVYEKGKYTGCLRKRFKTPCVRGSKRRCLSVEAEDVRPWKRERPCARGS